MDVVKSTVGKIMQVRFCNNAKRSAVTQERSETSTASVQHSDRTGATPASVRHVRHDSNPSVMRWIRSIYQEERGLCARSTCDDRRMMILYPGKEKEDEEGGRC